MTDGTLRINILIALLNSQLFLIDKLMEITAYRGLKSILKGSETQLLKQAQQNNKLLGKGATAKVLDLTNGAVVKIPNSFDSDRNSNLQFLEIPEEKIFFLEDTEELIFPRIAHGLTSANYEIFEYLEPAGRFDRIDFLLKAPGETLPGLLKGTKLIWGQYSDIPEYQLTNIRQKICDKIESGTLPKMFNEFSLDFSRAVRSNQRIKDDFEILQEGVYSALKFLGSLPQTALNGLYKSINELNDRGLTLECLPHNCMYDNENGRFSIIDISRNESFRNQPKEIGELFFHITDEHSPINILSIAQNLFKGDREKSLDIDNFGKQIRHKLDTASKQISN